MGVLDLILCYDQMVKEEPSDDDNYTDDDNDDGDAEMQKAIWIAQMQIWPAKITTEFVLPSNSPVGLTFSLFTLAGEA